MNTVDPHWQVEHEEIQEIPIHVRGNPSSPPVPLASPATRRPAAIVGVLMVLLMGFFFVHGVQTLRGQTNDESPLEVRITEEGFNPKSIEVKPGQDIRWINDDPTVPHILTSDTLLTIDGPLYTDHILPGDTFTTTIASDAKPGTFVYVSLTEDFAGEVVIADTAKKTPSTEIGKTASMPKTPQSQKSSQARLSRDGDLQGDPSSLTAQAVPQGPIPRNPYTVGSPLPSHSGKTTSPASAQIFGSSNTPKPFRQPETGPGLWIVSFMSIGSLLWITRHYFRSGLGN